LALTNSGRAIIVTAGVMRVVSSIGIKTANGRFYPILAENIKAKKRLVLTTVHDSQHSVQLDLYRNTTEEMSDAQYIGTLVVNKIKSRRKGDPSVELIISIDENGAVTADARDLDNQKKGGHAHLSVSLASLKKTDNDIGEANFELENFDDFTREDEYDKLVSQTPSNPDIKRRRSSPVLIILLITFPLYFLINIVFSKCIILFKSQ
jgi:molecular chaperone DnaK (HSP70)